MFPASLFDLTAAHTWESSTSKSIGMHKSDGQGKYATPRCVKIIETIEERPSGSSHRMEERNGVV